MQVSQNNNSTISAKHILFSIVALALLIRIVAVFMMVDPLEPIGDLQHDMHAENLVKGNGFRIDNLLSVQGNETPGSFGLDTLYSFKPPLYSFFLAGTYLVFGRNFIAVGIVQGIISALTCLLVFRIGKKIFDEKVGLIAAAILAIYPYLIFQSVRVMDTTLSTFLNVLSVLCLYHVRERPELKNMLAAGVAIGLAILCRPNMLIFIPFVALWLLAYPVVDRKKVATSITVVIFIFLSIIPWTIRNYLIHSKPVLIGTNGGFTFWQAHNEFTEKYLKMGSDFDPIAFSEGIDWKKKGFHKLTETEQDKWFYREGFKYIQENPMQLIKLAPQKFISLWGWTLYPFTESKLKNAIYTFSYGPLLLFGIAGMVLSYNKWEKTSLLIFLFISFSLAYIIFYGKTIYRSPIDPLLFIFSAYAIGELWLQLQKKFHHRGHSVAESQPKKLSTKA